MTYIEKQYKMMKILIAGLFIVAGLISCGSSGSGGDKVSYGRITGDVFFGIDEIDKTHVEGTVLTVVKIPENSENEPGSYDKNDNGATTVVDSNGKYMIRVPVGNYSVVAEGAGVSKAFGKVTVETNEIAVLDLTLEATAVLKGSIDHPDVNFGSYIKVLDTYQRTVCNENVEFLLDDISIGTHIIAVYTIDNYFIGSFYVTVFPGTNDVGAIRDLNPVPYVETGTAKNNDVVTASELSDFLIRFSTEMEPEATNSALSIITDTDIQDFQLDWYSGSILKISGLEKTLSGYYGPIEILINSDAISTGGKKLARPYRVSFIVGERITSTIPEHGYSFVYLEDPGSDSGLSQVEIVFSDSIEPASFNYEISPPLNGNAAVEWLSDGKTEGNICFIKGLFQNNTEYQVTVNSAETKNAVAISKLPYIFSFRTADFQVVSYYPENNAENVDIDSGITINFNGKVNHDDFLKKLHIKESATGTPVQVERVNWFEYYQYGERVIIYFPAEYRKSYDISIIDATSATGKKIDDFNSHFSTMIPEVKYKSINASNIISLTFNVAVEWERSDFSLTNADDGSNVPFNFLKNSGGTVLNYDKGISDRFYICPVEPLESETGFILSWNKLETIDNYFNTVNVEAGSYKFITEPLLLTKTAPSAGAQYVSVDNHSFSFSFNRVLTDGVKTTIENAISVSALRNSESKIISPVFIWQNGYSGRTSTLYADFTFEYDTVYTIDVDTSGNAQLNNIFKIGNKFMFSTKKENSSVAVFNRFNSAYELQHGYNGWTIELRFNVWALLTEVPLNQILDIRTSSGQTIEALGIVSTSGSSSDRKMINNKLHAKRWKIEGLPLDFGKEYYFTLKNAIPFFDEGGDYNYNLPSTAKIMTESPGLGIQIDNDNGVISIQATDYDFYMNIAAVKSAISTTPSTLIFDDFYNDQGTQYARQVKFRYNPVTTAHIMFNLSSLTAWLSKSGTYIEICKFKNTPLEQVFSISPNIIEPELDYAFTTGSHTVDVTFNTDLDAGSARNIANYRISNVGSPDLQIQNIILTKPGSNIAVDDQYVGPVNPVVQIETAGEIKSGLQYMVKVHNITEWGGHYTITEGSNSFVFSGYDGVLAETYAYKYTHRKYQDGSLIYDYGIVVPLIFDVPVKTDAFENKVAFEVAQGNGGMYYTIQPDKVTWNAQKTAVAFTFTAGNSVNAMIINFIGDIQNQQSGESIYIGNYSRRLSFSYERFEFYCYGQSATGNELRVRWSGVAPDNYTNPLLYSLSHRTQTPNIPTVQTITNSSQGSDISLILSGNLTNNERYLLSVGGVYDPKLTKLGLGAATPPISKEFTY